jgi:peptide-methionine (S)-S-oxide reductase
MRGEIETAVFAAGCFWHIEEAFLKVSGVIKTRAGYAGGTAKNPTYEQVCSGATGHAESVEVVYDPAKISYEKLLAVFWKIHDPTSLNRQGPDVGTNYRSAIFYQNERQRKAAMKSRDELQKRMRSGKIVTEINRASGFYPAEEYHQKYFAKRGKACSLSK